MDAHRGVFGGSLVANLINKTGFLLVIQKTFSWKLIWYLSTYFRKVQSILFQVLQWNSRADSTLH